MKLQVVGLGKLGLPLASVLERAGHEVIGVDSNTAAVSFAASVAAGHPAARYLEPDVQFPDSIEFTSMARRCDMSFIVVPTPSTADGSFDYDAVSSALFHVSARNPSDHTAVLISTVSPGTCDKLAANYPNLNLVYNPTLIALGNVVKGLTCPDLLMIGFKEAYPAQDVAQVWESVFDAFPESRRQTVTHVAPYKEIELIKLSINCAISTKITLANSLGQLFKAHGVDPAAVRTIGLDHRIGMDYFRPGAPFGGPCFTRDNQALQHAGNEVGVSLPLSKATDYANNELRRAILIEAQKHDHESVGILGVAYKYGTNVIDGALGAGLKGILSSRVTASYKWYDEYIDGSDSLEDVLSCDVVVVTQPELRPLVSDDGPYRLVDPWS